jgi:predicted transposase/invertase (TIGR01784 family)
MSDLFSRWLLSREETIEILEDLVNATLEHAGKPPVHALELRKPFNLGTAFQEKESILDIRTKDSSGAYINLEVQLGRQSMFFNRVLYYWAKTWSDQLARGESYRQLLPVISINLTAYTLFPDLDAWHTLFHLTEETQPDVALGDQKKSLTRHLSLMTNWPHGAIFSDMRV